MSQLSDIVEKPTMSMQAGNPDDGKHQDTAFSTGYQQGVLINNVCKTIICIETHVRDDEDGTKVKRINSQIEGRDEDVQPEPAKKPARKVR